MRSDTYKGYFFALLATVAYSNIYIFSKAALNVVHLIQFGFYWYALGTLFNLAWSIKSGKLRQVLHLNRRQAGVLLLLGFLEICTNTTFFLSIHIIPDPSVTSFLGNLYPVLLTLAGVVLLKERFTWLESAGVLLALAGAFIISYTGGSSLKNMFIPGAGVVLINAIFAVAASVVVKMNIKRLSPELITLNHTIWLFLYAAILMVVFDKPLEIPGDALLNIAIGSFLGPFLGILTIYYSFRYMEASRSSIVQSMKGIVVLGGAYLYFGTLPLPHQLLGGLLTVAGVLLMTLAQAGLLRFRRKQPAG
ncbi:MAG TPA: DMT family transporter [Prolixibacteraceae bacterium]|nr:DMT family transporter [Prolixibacteraceae bacterium]